MRQAGHGRSAASSPLEEQGDSEAVGKEAAPSTCRPSSSCQQPREGVCEMVAPGDGKLVRLREMTLKEGRGLTSWCLVCGAGRGRPRGGERERARQGGGDSGRGGPTPVVPPSFGLETGTQEHGGAGLSARLLGGGRDRVQRVLESPSSPPVHRPRAGRQLCGWRALGQSGKCSLLFKELLGSGEGAADPWLQQAGLGFPFLLRSSQVKVVAPTPPCVPTC